MKRPPLRYFRHPDSLTTYVEPIAWEPPEEPPEPPPEPRRPMPPMRVIERPRYVPASEARHRDMVQRFEAGESVTKIAASYGVADNTVEHHLRRLGVAPFARPKPKVVGTAIDVDRWHAVLPDDVAHLQIAWERRRFALRAWRAGLRQADIARRLGMSKGRVGQLIAAAERERDSTPPAVRWWRRIDPKLWERLRE